MTKLITLEDIRNNADFSTMVHQANECLAAIGYTDHGPRHVGYVSRVAADILSQLGFDKRRVELAAIAGWLHDVGNLINRKNHGHHGAMLVFPILLGMGMPMEEVCLIASAIGNHEEQTGAPVNDIAAALIIADKIDAHRTRVRRGKYNANDIHDRVNYSISKTNISVDREKREIRFEFKMDETSSIMEFMVLYTSRMLMCEKSAQVLGCTFALVANSSVINNHRIGLAYESGREN